MTRTKMPTREEFDAADRRLKAAGWEHVATLMADDAKKPGVTDFGRKYSKGAGMFWLNYKTIRDLPMNRKPHDAGRESDLPERLRP
jgi:hypothetical protein